MSKHYRVKSHPDDPKYLTICLEQDMYQDLAQFAHENGHTLNLEVMLRLARTLEHDLERIFEDDFIKLIAINKRS